MFKEIDLALSIQTQELTTAVSCVWTHPLQKWISFLGIISMAFGWILIFS